MSRVKRGPYPRRRHKRVIIQALPASVFVSLARWYGAGRHTFGTRGGSVQTRQTPFTPLYLPFDAEAWTRAWKPGKL